MGHPLDRDDLSEKLDLPVDVGSAIMSGRAALLSFIPPDRTFNAVESKQMINAVRVLVDTNARLQRQLATWERKGSEIAKNMIGNGNVLMELDKFAREDAENFMAGKIPSEA